MARCGRCLICSGGEISLLFTTSRTKGFSPAEFRGSRAGRPSRKRDSAKPEARILREGTTHDSGEEMRERHRAATGSRRREAADGAEADLHL
jgi:hypothetical protein